MKTFVGEGKLCVYVILSFLAQFFISCTTSERFKEVVVEVESVLLNEPSVTLSEGESIMLTLTITPSDATDKTVTWYSSDEGVATVRDGKIQAVNSGTATITAKMSNGKSAICAVTVTRKIIEIESIELNRNKLTLVVGASSVLTATIKPADAAERTVGWESDNPKVVTVKENGEVKAVSAGIARVTAKAGGFSAVCDVTVMMEQIPVTQIVLNKTSLSLTEGAKEQLSATVFPENTTEQVVWSSVNPQIAVVDEQGVVTAVGLGSTTIVAKAGEQSVACAVAVVSPSEDDVINITLNKTSLNLMLNDSETLEATVYAADVSKHPVVWSSSNMQVASVDSEGVVSAVGVGTATVTASAGSKSVECVVTVAPLSEDDVINITLNKTTLSLVLNDFEALEATVYAADVSKYPVSWSSSNTQVATVDGEGVVLAAGVGTATITASAGSKSVVCVVTVSPAYIKITNVVVEPSTHTMEIGEEVQLSAAVYPANSTSRSVFWYSKDIHKATVDIETGLVKAVSEGRVAIVAMTEEDEDVMDSCVIMINAAYIPVENIILNKTELILTEEGTETISAVIIPSAATNQFITWSSDRPDIVTIDKDGNIKAVSVGETIIRAEADGKSASCIVTVEEQEGQTVPISDPVFEAFLVSRFDYDQNGKISTTEIARVTELNCQSQNITSLDGLQYFKSLEILNCQNNRIIDIDLSRNTSLRSVNCRNNGISILDVRALTRLEKLICDENNLNEINIRNNVLLKEFSCASNYLVRLDVSNNPELYNFNCSNNGLTVIDVERNQKLTVFMCNGNNLSGQGLNITNNELLNVLYCTSCGLTGLNLNNNPKLTTLICDQNNLSSLDISGNGQISVLYCQNNRISGNLDISMLKSIDRFDCTSNEIVTLFISPEVEVQWNKNEIKVFDYDDSVDVQVK